MNNIKLPFLKMRDAIIIIALILIGTVLIILPLINTTNSLCEINFDGQIIKTIDLSKAEDTIFTLDEVHDVTFEIKNHEIKIKSSNCTDKICENTGYIHSPMQVIVCLPNKLVIKIIANDNDVDLIVG